MSLRRSRDLSPVVMDDLGGRFDHEIEIRDRHVSYEDRRALGEVRETMQEAVAQAVAETLTQLDGLSGVVVQNLHVTVNIGVANGGGAMNVIDCKGDVITR